MSCAGDLADGRPPADDIEFGASLWHTRETPGRSCCQRAFVLFLGGASLVTAGGLGWHLQSASRDRGIVKAMAARRTLLWAALVASCLGPGSMLAQPAAALRAAPARRSWTPAAGGVRMMVSLPSPTTKPKDGGVGVLEREVTPKRDPLAKTVGDASVNDGMFQVLLFNDEVNTREYVARCLVVVCGLSEGDGNSMLRSSPHAHVTSHHVARKTQSI
mmetsp:Transcript_31683/g.100631  ORF Transcript_31683/g.100631 Transcript_31683/m.100631 type:complete len:217 (-) Transcript_31683:2430-3080(-)